MAVLTRALVITVSLCSVAVAAMRLMAYYIVVSTVAEADKALLDASMSEDIVTGLNFPPPQKTVDEIVVPNDFYVPFLTIVPGYTPLYYLWVLFTASFVEQNLVSYLQTCMVVGYGGRYCEQVWGPREFGAFVVLLTVVPNAIVSVVYTLLYEAFEPETVHTVPTICGAGALVAGFLVAFKQLLPQHTIVLFRGTIRLRVPELAAYYLLGTSILGIFGYGLWTMQAWTGFVVAWMYLRFYRVTYVDPLLPLRARVPLNVDTTSATVTSIDSYHEHANPSGIRIRGDASDSFAISHFFPEPIRHIVERVGTPIFNLVVAIGVVKPFTAPEVDAANLRATARSSLQQSGTPRRLGTASGGLSARAEAERRRSMALKALEQQLRFPQADSAYSTLPTMPPPAARYQA